MRDDYPRLFEAAVLENGLPNPRHLSTAAYLARARTAAADGARRNGVPVARRRRRRSPTAASHRPACGSRCARGLRQHRRAATPAPGRRGRAAVAELAPEVRRARRACRTTVGGGGYDGPLAYRMGKPMRPDVAQAFDRMAAAARRAGIVLSITSAFRSDAEQARLFAANPNPKWVAPPGTSLHRYGTELDLGPPGAYGWLAGNARRFGFIHRYAWEPWHYGFGANPRDVPAQYERGSWEPPGGDHGRISSRLPSFVPRRFHDPIAAAALRWNVPMNLLAAQLYAESGSTRSRAAPPAPRASPSSCPAPPGRYGLSDPFDADAAIMAQAHLMHDLLKQFGGKIALALAGYNAGAGAVRALRRRPAVPRDPRLRREDPRHARRRRRPRRARSRGAPRGIGSRHGTTDDRRHRRTQGDGRRDGRPDRLAEITQDMIDTFAQLSGDHQWIHVDVERAKNESPFGRRSRTAT